MAASRAGCACDPRRATRAIRRACPRRASQPRRSRPGRKGTPPPWALPSTMLGGEGLHPERDVDGGDPRRDARQRGGRGQLDRLARASVLVVRAVLARPRLRRREPVDVHDDAGHAGQPLECVNSRRRWAPARVYLAYSPSQLLHRDGPVALRRRHGHHTRGMIGLGATAPWWRGGRSR